MSDVSSNLRVGPKDLDRFVPITVQVMGCGDAQAQDSASGALHYVMVKMIVDFGKMNKTAVVRSLHYDGQSDTINFMT